MICAVSVSAPLFVGEKPVKGVMSSNLQTKMKKKKFSGTRSHLRRCVQPHFTRHRHRLASSEHESRDIRLFDQACAVSHDDTTSGGGTTKTMDNSKPRSKDSRRGEA